MSHRSRRSLSRCRRTCCPPERLLRSTLGRRRVTSSCLGARRRLRRPRAAPPRPRRIASGYGVTASQLLVAASATLALALNAEAMRYDYVRVGIALFAVSLCLFLVPLILRCDSVYFHGIVCFSLATAAPFMVVAGVVMALLNVRDALGEEELAPRLHFAMQPTTWVCTVYGAVAFGAGLGSRPPEQLSHRAKALSCALLVVVPLVADLILVVRSGDLRFLVGQACFGAPMAAVFWQASRGPRGPRKQPAAKQRIAHAAQASVRGCQA